MEKTPEGYINLWGVVERDHPATIPIAGASAANCDDCGDHEAHRVTNRSKNNRRSFLPWCPDSGGSLVSPSKRQATIEAGKRLALGLPPKLDELRRLVQQGCGYDGAWAPPRRKGGVWMWPKIHVRIPPALKAKLEQVGDSFHMSLAMVVERLLAFASADQGLVEVALRAEPEEKGCEDGKDAA